MKVITEVIQILLCQLRRLLASQFSQVKDENKKEQLQPVCIYKAPTLITSLTVEALHQSILDSVHLYSSSSSLIPNQIENVRGAHSKHAQNMMLPSHASMHHL